MNAVKTKWTELDNQTTAERAGKRKEENEKYITERKMAARVFWCLWLRPDKRSAGGRGADQRWADQWGTCGKRFTYKHWRITQRLKILHEKASLHRAVFRLYNPENEQLNDVLIHNIIFTNEQPRKPVMRTSGILRINDSSSCIWLASRQTSEPVLTQLGSAIIFLTVICISNCTQKLIYGFAWNFYKTIF